MAPPAGAEVRKAVGGVELADAVGDATPITSTDADYPGFDIVKLALVSDGRTLAIVATLRDAPGVFASSAADRSVEPARRDGAEGAAGALRCAHVR